MPLLQEGQCCACTLDLSTMLCVDCDVSFQVREATTLLDIDVKFFPCPKGGPTWRPKVQPPASKASFRVATALLQCQPLANIMLNPGQQEHYSKYFSLQCHAVGNATYSNTAVPCTGGPAERQVTISIHGGPKHRYTDARV